jgi:hypothetical protein
MLYSRTLFFLCVFFLGILATAASQTGTQHFIFFSRDREKIHDSSFYNHPGIRGAQITYSWKQLERTKDKYDFSEIEEDLRFLQSHGKRLWIQLQDVTFDSNNYATPAYLMSDMAYHGGVNSQYSDNPPYIKAGWVTRRWDPAVAERFHKLLGKLAERFDGKIAGINLPETSVGFPEGLEPEGFNSQNYVRAIKSNMKVLKENFSKSTPLLYANFMPDDSKQDLREIYSYAREIKLAMGGPDIKVYRPFQMANSYPLIRDLYGIVPTGVAVQDGNYSVINPRTGKQVTLKEIMDFAKEYLRLSYVFWCTEEPYYSAEVLPMLRNSH